MTWEDLVAWMRSPEVQAVVAKYEPEPEAEEPGKPQQMALFPAAASGGEGEGGDDLS